MSIELQSSMPAAIRTSQAVPPPRTEPIVGGEAVPQRAAALPPAVKTSVEPQAKVSGNQSGEQQVDQAAQKAAELMFSNKEVEVRGFRDDGSGRFVYRISDKTSGQILTQTPPDALLRFYASYEGVSKPLVSVDV